MVTFEDALRVAASCIGAAEVARIVSEAGVKVKIVRKYKDTHSKCLTCLYNTAASECRIWAAECINGTSKSWYRRKDV